MHRVHTSHASNVGRRFQLSLAVADVKETYQRLKKLEEDDVAVAAEAAADEEARRGKKEWVVSRKPFVIEGLTEPRPRSWQVSAITFQDPAGHCWELVQEIPGGRRMGARAGDNRESWEVMGYDKPMRGLGGTPLI